MSLAIFDLDNTLLADDSDYLWGQFLAKLGVVDATWYESENQRFYDAYKAGNLDIFEFLAFSLKPLAEHDMATLQGWHTQFMNEVIRPLMLAKAQALVDQHRDKGDTLLIITATNHFVTAPIAKAYGIEHLLATEPEIIDGRYTGNVAGTPCFQEGKVERLNDWLKTNQHSLKGSYFYSDSHNDLPLLKMVDHPITVDADNTLIAYAEKAGWQQISLR
ncbi:MAG: HAD family hydrolase [Sulfuriflexus sp.]|nr:HAD family hydrolase [Sulfuriflexus sp.]